MRSSTNLVWAVYILPLFDSGVADSFLYYVMPFIDGETLRDKLNRRPR